MNSYFFENRHRDKRDWQIYLDYREKIKRCLQFSPGYLFGCLMTVLFSFAVLHFDRYHQLHCSAGESLILNSNQIVNFGLYFKFLISVYLCLFNQTERIFSSLTILLTVLLFEFTGSLLHMCIAILEMFMKIDCYNELFERKLIFPNDQLIDFFTRRTKAQISSILHVVLSVLILHDLFRFSVSARTYMQLLKLENRAFESIKASVQV